MGGKTAAQRRRRVKQIVLDKTGTLTEGRPIVREIEAVDVSVRELLAVAAAAEASSEHPLAKAMVKASFEHGATPPDVASFEATPGQGVVAKIGSSEVLVGNPRFLVDRNIDLTRLRKGIETLEAAGRTVIGVARDERAQCYISAQSDHDVREDRQRFRIFAVALEALIEPMSA
jgi:P-type E1-E2 ATPase